MIPSSQEKLWFFFLIAVQRFASFPTLWKLAEEGYLPNHTGFLVLWLPDFLQETRKHADPKSEPQQNRTLTQISVFPVRQAILGAWPSVFFVPVAPNNPGKMCAFGEFGWFISFLFLFPAVLV